MRVDARGPALRGAAGVSKEGRSEVRKTKKWGGGQLDARFAAGEKEVVRLERRLGRHALRRVVLEHALAIPVGESAHSPRL